MFCVYSHVGIRTLNFYKRLVVHAHFHKSSELGVDDVDRHKYIRNDVPMHTLCRKAATTKKVIVSNVFIHFLRVIPLTGYALIADFN